MIMCIRLDTIPEYDGQTDGRTELLKQYRALLCMLKRDKNCSENISPVDLS